MTFLLYFFDNFMFFFMRLYIVYIFDGIAIVPLLPDDHCESKNSRQERLHISKNLFCSRIGTVATGNLLKPDIDETIMFFFIFKRMYILIYFYLN